MGGLVTVSNLRIHNTRENRIKYPFKAQTGTALVIYIFAIAALVALLSLSFLILPVKPVHSESAEGQGFGEEHTTNIFPTKIEAPGWNNADEAFSQDLDDYALYQAFDDDNSAYFGEDMTSVDANENEGAPDVQTIEEGEVDVVEEEGLLEPETPTLETEIEAEPESEVEMQPAAEPEPDPISYLDTSQFRLKPAGVFPLAQLTLNSTTESTAPGVVEEIVFDATESLTEEVSTEVEEVTVESDTPVELSLETNDVVLSDFDTASLEPGHFVESMQLRLSLAASARTEGESLPYIDVLFKNNDNEELRSVGSIVIDEETSNAINGGYFLFTLPSFIPVEELEQSKVVLRVGGAANIKSVYLDAVWLEMNTRVITKEDLEDRGVAEELEHLEPPTLTTLLSEQLNFAPEEAPVFNLRYETQQNFIVRGFMKLIGRGGLSVKSISVNHDSIGHIEVNPNVTIAGDGLVTIEIPKEDLPKMRPGSYFVTLLFEENGMEYTDSFDFQWGILTINPNKTTYTVGEVTEIYMGALSPNGNTLCEANLALYITSPTGVVTKSPVDRSGQCNGNNIIDVPDYTATFVTTEIGDYEMYLERLDENGEVIGFTKDTFIVVETTPYSIERKGPTRIFPPATYPMQITVAAEAGFTGVLKERVPASFTVGTTSAEVTIEGDFKVLSWNLSIPVGGSQTVEYDFDAPDISPYLYEVGQATLEGDVTINKTAEITASSSDGLASTTTETLTTTEKQIVFAEHRQWQIASDATGSLLLMWDGGTIPAGWTCVSCAGGDAFYQRFIIGSSTAGTNGGATTHTHTVPAAAVGTTGSAGASNAGGGGTDAATLLHTHTLAAPAIGTANNLPSYRNLVIIQYNSAGEPTSIPANAIAMFDATVPSGWTQYSAQNGFYVRGESIANRTVTGGSNTHTHTITGTLSGPTGTTNASNGPTAVASQNHTHTISSNTAAENSEPPYIEAILGKLTATTTLPNDVIGMWTDTEPSDWNAVSTTSTAFSSRFFKPAASYGTTGGASVHTPANVNGIVSSGPNNTNNRQTAGVSDAPGGHTHSVNVTTFTSGNILPQYRSVILAKRAGGQPPSAPTVHELFDHEKTGTSTPQFEFTGDDSVGTDTLVYQFQWDDDSDVETSPLGDRSSDDETGCSPNCFENTVNGGDSSPFTEAERIRFSIQSALTNGTTYYYRVRAIKTTGSTWGSWSEIYSFTYDDETDPSQWLQTEDAQFSKGTLSDTEVYGSNSVRILQNAPDEALVAYGEGVITTPRYRIWDGSAWSASELSALDVGGVVEWIKVEPGVTRDEYILGTQDANSDVNVQVYDGVADTWGDLQEVTTAVPDITRRGFDITYESQSGYAMVAYCNGSDVDFRFWDGSSWSSASTTATVSANNCNYVALASDPTSDEIILVTRDTAAGGTDYEAKVWSGTAWTLNTTMGNMTNTNNEGIAVEYEESGGQALVTVSNGGGNNFSWTAWDGTEWSTPLTHSLGDDYQWGILKADVGTDNIALCYVDTDNDLGIVRWDGDMWQTAQEFEIGGYVDTGRDVSCEFETTAGRDGYIMVPHSNTTNSRYTYWNGSTLSATSTISTITEAWEIGTTRTGDGNVLSYFHDSVNTNYDFSYWNGTIWSAVQTLETSASVTSNPRKQPIGMAAQVFIPSEGTITTDEINFTTVPNRPTWGEVSWSTVEPSGTDVKLQLLYATTTGCNTLIPNGVLSGNDTGFDASASPLDLTSLSTTTYNKICLRATLTSGNSSTPTLDDWTVSWERQSFLVQSQFRWYANANSENPSDAWPTGAINLNQNEAIPVDYSPGSGDILRLRLAVRSDNADLAASEKAFKLQFAQSSGICASSTAWFDVGAVGSTTALWRGYNNLLAFDGSTLSTLLLGTDVGGTYEEENDSDVNPNQIVVGDEAEWDWTLEHNGAEDGTQYCFRMVNDEGTTLSDYEEYPSLITNDSPQAPTLDKLFDNEQVASTTPWFEFSTLDTENDDITYQIQVDDTYDFSSTALDRNSVTNFAEFENIVTPADRDPFTVSQTVRFKPTSALTNGVTYYWRVRGKDGLGSNDWGDWSTVSSVTIDTGTTVTTWFQTTEEQFAIDNNDGTEVTAFDDLVLTSGFLNGTTTTAAIDFDDKTTGNAWGNLSWSHNVTSGSIVYRVEYFDSENWLLVPDAFLPGNNAGFTSDPVSLLGLDPQVHNQIRVRANLTDSSGSPRLLSLKVEWGFAVEQPTQLSLFDNEKTGTTTPTFTFTTTDPDDDDIQYEFSWSTDSTFTTGVNVATSGVSAGFANETVGIDTSPFFSGDTISYKIQSALSNGTTYWWRVRGKDPLDGDAWSVWSPSRSFTVDNTVSVSTWYQTTDAQFNTNTLEDTETTGSGEVEITTTIREAFTAYAEGTVQTPRYRIWNGATWGDEETGTSVGGSIRFVETAAAPTRDEYVIATQDSTGRVRAQIYNGGTDSTGNLQTIITAVPSATRRGFDIAYESTSGDLIVVACDTTEATYYVWNGSTWTGPTARALNTAGSCNWIQMGPDPTSDEIVMVARDDIAGATDYEAWVWSGSGWGNNTAFGVATEAADEGIAIEYEESGDRAVVVLPNSTTAGFIWNAWSGSAWDGTGTVSLQDDFENGRLARDLGSDDLVLCSIDNDGQIAYLPRVGTTNTWTTPYQTVDTLGNSKVGRPFGCQYETTAGRDGYIMMPYSDTGAAQYRVYDGATFPAENAISTIQDSFEVRSIRTGDGNILALFYDDIGTQYDFSYWNGTLWSTLETLEATAITTTNPVTVPLDMVARRYPAFTSGIVYSSAIDFDDGSGLKWQQATFTDTTPGSSNILYQIEYYDGDSWELIPNAALAGNSSGFTTSPIDLSQVSRITYNTIRLRANLSCSDGDCPTLSDWSVEWSAGINVAGTLKQYDQTSSTTAGTVAVAVNGVLQSGKTASVSNGTWSIANVTAFIGDTVSVFVTGAADTAEAIGVTQYDGDGDITGINMFERHLSLGSNDATSTPLTNSNIGTYDFTNSEDLFFNVDGSTLTMCATAVCHDAELYIRSGTYYTPGGRIITHDFENNGTFTAGSYTHEVNGSWDNNASTTMTGSTVTFAATSTTETIDSTGALFGSFNNVTLGTTTGSGVWTLGSTLDVDGNFTITRGTWARSTRALTLGGNLDIATNGFITGIGTTTFDGSTAATWRNQNAALQNSGKVVVDGTSKAVTLASSVAAESITIGANDTLDASGSSHDITVYGNWNNQNNFVARSGEVFFAATSTGKTITTAGDAFFDLTFSGSSGGWSFTEATALINNDMRFTAGTATLSSATTTIAGSFIATTGTFQHNNGSLYFTSGSSETITMTGGAFTNVTNNLWFQGAGSWTVSDTNATSTNNVVVQQGTLNFPSGVMAIGGTLRDIGGIYAGGSGTVRFYSATAKLLTAGGSSFSNVTFAGAGSWSFTDTNVTVSRNLTVQQGTLTLPTVAILIAGSYDNNATVVPGTGNMQFNSTDAGETIDFGASSLYNLTFSSAGGGWTMLSNGTTTNALTITSATSLTANPGVILSVGGTFTNSVGGAATTWTGSTLALRAGTYSLNTKANPGDTYGDLAVAAGTKISMWNSSADSYSINSTGSLYSQDHNAVDGDLYIFGAYTRTSGTEYWAYANDFDGTALGGSSRQVDVRFASGASAALTSSTLNLTGVSAATTTIDNQGSGTYTVSATGGTVSAQYYDFANLGATGLSLLGAATVSQLSYGSYQVAAVGGSAITLSSTTIDANPSKQVLGVTFATTSAIAAYNVSQTDGTPTSFWWFRDGFGNLYGEAKDNDTGNPGSVRFNDSSLVFEVAGTVYTDAGVTPLVGGTCDGGTAVVKVVVDGGASYTGSCSNIDGSYSIPGVTVTGDPTITIYLDGASGGEKGSIITRTPTADILDADIYANRVIVRNEDIDPLTITNLAVYDADNDSDLGFIAVDAGTDTLTVQAGNELFVWDGATFTPGGALTLNGNAGANSYDGTLYLDDNATLNFASTSTNTIGGRLVVDAGATLSTASTTILMNATTSGKSITAAAALSFYNLTFNGSGGSWNLTPAITVASNMTITAGTVTGTGNITLTNGSLSGNGILSLGAGTVTLARTNTLGGTSPWTFYNLQLGNGTNVGTTTPVFTATTTISNILTISAAHYLDAGATNWDLAGTGSVFVETGTFLEDTSTIRYSGNGANVRSTPYYNLDINAGAGSPTYTAIGLGIIVANDLTVGGTAATNFNVTTNDPALDVNGDIQVRSNGTFVASNSGALTVAQNFTNDGTFTASGGTVTFDGATATNVEAGNSSFASVMINKTGALTVTEHATATVLWRLQAASSFTVNSGQILAVGGTFYNAVGGAATTWTGSTLSLYGNGNYHINAATTTDSYATLAVDGTTQIRMWNSDATSYNVDSTASLYSQDHANQAGDLYIWGSYRRTTGSDYWAYANDFDGTALGGSSRKVDVFMASGASALFTGGSLDVRGISTASTTIQNQGSGSYALTIGGTASTSLRYYEITDINSSGLVLTSTPTVATLSNGLLEVSQNAGTAMTVGGTVITANPAKNFNQNIFRLDGVGSGFNVTATGTSVSAWRFANHAGDIDGEGFDVDPNGDPGYVSWDDSAALITVSGYVYSDESGTVSGVCDGSTNNVTLRVAGITTYSTDCDAGTGEYIINNVSYGTADTLVVYIDGETEKGAAVTQDPISNISSLSIYENRVVVRHEGTDPLTIDDMSVWDSSDDGDIPFTAVSGSPDTLTLGADRKLIVSSSKTFAPGGNVTLSGGGAGGAHDGTLELYSNADWTAAGTESLSIGGSMILGSGANYAVANGTTTFTTTGASRTIDVNGDSFHHVAFSGAGSWTITDTNFTTNGNVLLTAGTLDLPTGTSTFNGSFVNNGGTFDANSGVAYFNGASTHNVRLGGSDLATTTFSGGTYTFLDTNATTTSSITIESGTVVLPSGNFSVGGNFTVEGGAITHNTSDVYLTNVTAATLLASTSDLYTVRFSGGGSYNMLDEDITLLGSLFVSNGSAVDLASGTIAIGGSFVAASGTFEHSSSTILFNSTDTGEVINPGVSEFYAVQIGAPTGGYTLTGNATTTHNFTLQSATSFSADASVVLRVEGVFTNNVGGTNTNWNSSTLVLDGTNAYTINTKVAGADQYSTLRLGADSDIRMWNSAATTTTVDAASSLYSQDHATINGYLYIYGDFHLATSSEYWSYATDFDGTALGGSSRTVNVRHSANATTTVDGGVLNIVGTSGNRTVVTNQGSGTFALAVTSGTLNATYYDMNNLATAGLSLSGSPTISSLSYGNFELAVNGGSLITVSSSTLNANASMLIPGMSFATTTAITGNNVTVVGSTANAWTFTTHTGNLDGEAFDDDGVDACGSIRWVDSSCLITQQTHYRWRNDDGGVGVQASEWYDSNWDARKSVRIDNVDATTYTDAVVQVNVTFDSDMQADFDDLRFTSENGTTIIPHWIGSSTNSSAAEVWVKVPSLPAEGTANLFMYYNHPTATSSASVDNTFLAADDFEDNDITEYSGQTTLFGTAGTFAYDGAYGLDNAGDEGNRANLGGIYRTDQTINQGETIRYWQYIDTAAGDDTCTKFAVQSGSPNNNYSVCVGQFGVDRFALAENAIENDTSGTVLASSTVSYSNGWYEIEVVWETDDDIIASLYDSTGTLVTSISDNDPTYTSGGFGFTYWGNYGGWDSFSSRPTLATQPTVRFGSEQFDGGATWKASLDTVASYDINDIARLRVAIENSGLPITNQQLLLEYAALGVAPSCEAVDPNDFATVPVQASCGTSPVCMQSSTLITNGDSIGDLLFNTLGLYTLGQVREDPSNITGNINIGQDEYTEVEYAITPTADVVDENICFRVTNNSTPFDTYLKVAHLALQFDPTVTNAVLNEGLDINLLPGTTTTVYATGTVTDLNGAADIAYGTSTIYRIGATGGASCTPNDNDCYVSQCIFTNCAGNSCDIECQADIYFHADPTDDGAYMGEEWLAFIEVEDSNGGYAFDDSIGVALNSLRAIDVESAITYGAVEATYDTGATNASTTIENLGNTEINIEVEGSDMTDGTGSTIPAAEQKFATSTFTYSACTSCYALSSTTPYELDVELVKPTSYSPILTDDVYWGVEVPFGTNSTAHSGINVFTPVSP
ncbi:MAG: DUF2341 domain-containing protein [Patescibacteria group bacterium]